jgi:hypothetical protein
MFNLLSEYIKHTIQPFYYSHGYKCIGCSGEISYLTTLIGDNPSYYHNNITNM